jgi:replicative DNA helicase
LTTPDAEYALVVRLLLEPEHIADVASKLSPEDFSESKYSDVFRIIVDRHQAGKQVDTVTVEAESGYEIDVLGLPLGSRADVDTYVEAIKKAAVRRELVGALDTARDRVVATDDEPVSIVEGAVEKILRARGSATLVGSTEATSNYEATYELRRTEGGGIPYGVGPLDRLLLPARAGRLIMVASRPSVGKTALAENIADEWAKHGPVLYVSLEMSTEEMLDRAVARDSGISLERITRGEVHPDELRPWLDNRRESRVYYLDEASVTLAAVRGAAARVKLMNQGQLVGIIIDYIQLLADVGDEEVYRIGKISHATKRLARAMQCPVLALAQFNRRIEQAESPRAPKLSDLRDSGVLEQDADVVVAVVGEPGKSQRELHVLKQRQGKTGSAPVYFDGEHMRWYDNKEGQLAW